MTLKAEKYYEKKIKLNIFSFLEIYEGKFKNGLYVSDIYYVFCDQRINHITKYTQGRNDEILLFGIEIRKYFPVDVH